jgi:hypothetical protein
MALPAQAPSKAAKTAEYFMRGLQTQADSPVRLRYPLLLSAYLSAAPHSGVKVSRRDVGLIRQ